MCAQNSQRQADALPVQQIASLFKCSQYKNSGSVKKVSQDKGPEESKVQLIETETETVVLEKQYLENVAGVEASQSTSNFTRVNP